MGKQLISVLLFKLYWPPVLSEEACHSPRKSCLVSYLTVAFGQLRNHLPVLGIKSPVVTVASRIVTAIKPQGLPTPRLQEPESDRMQLTDAHYHNPEATKTRGGGHIHDFYDNFYF